MTTAAAAGRHGPDSGTINIFVEDTSGQRYECDIPSDTPVHRLTSDFFEERGWSTSDRAVAELVDPQNSGRSKRLNGEHNLFDAGLRDGDTIRIFPEAIAGIEDARSRLQALVADHNEMKALESWHPGIRFRADREYAPVRYNIQFDCKSVEALDLRHGTPVWRTAHEAEITLPADYPGEAPLVKWRTPIFHPNIHPENGAVCLGVLGKRYRPGLGLARITLMLWEMVRFQNFDMTNALNKEAAQWTVHQENWRFIREMGGSPFQGPLRDFQVQVEKIAGRSRIAFSPVTGGNPGAGR